MDDYIDTGNATITPDPLYSTTGEQIHIGNRLVGRVRRLSSGSYTGTSTISGLSVVGDYTPTDPSSPEMFRRTTRADAIRLVLAQAREDLRDEARQKRGHQA